MSFYAGEFSRGSDPPYCRHKSTRVMSSFFDDSSACDWYLVYSRVLELIYMYGVAME